MVKKITLILIAGLLILSPACSGDPAYVHVDNPLGIIGYGGPVNWLGDLVVEPLTATLADAYHNTVDGYTYFYDGDSWEVLAAPGDTGAQGIPGPTGTPGLQGENGTDGTAFTWRDTWNDSTDYVINDVANHTGTSYICIANNTNQEPPNLTYWDLMAQKGDTGATGSTGSTGATGAPGPNLITNTTATDLTGILVGNGTYVDVIPDNSTVWNAAAQYYGKRICEIKLIDDATAIAANAGNFSFCIPASLNGYNLVGANAFVTTVSSSGTPSYQVINVTDSVNMLSVAITIDANEFTSYTAATQPTIDTAKDDVATGDILKINKTVAGTGSKGDGVILTFQMP